MGTYMILRRNTAIFGAITVALTILELLTRSIGQKFRVILTFSYTDLYTTNIAFVCLHHCKSADK